MKPAFHIAVCSVAAACAMTVGCTKDTANSGQPKSGDISTAPAPLPRDEVLDAYVADMREDLANGKIGIINDVMHLSNEESLVFWPIYQEYEKALFELGDARVEDLRRFAAAQTAGTLNDEQATKLAEAWFGFETKRLKLLRNYYDQIASRLSPVRAAQFTQIENRVGTVIDLVIAAELPLVRKAPSATP